MIIWLLTLKALAKVGYFMFLKPELQPNERCAAKCKELKPNRFPTARTGAE